jgi:hypothetical protein
MIFCGEIDHGTARFNLPLYNYEMAQAEATGIFWFVYFFAVRSILIPFTPAILHDKPKKSSS